VPHLRVDSPRTRLARISIFDFWFRPKTFESESLYRRMGALVLKRYAPTGGDIVMGRLRRRYPRARLVKSSLLSLRAHERRTRLSEAVHLIGVAVFGTLAIVRFASGSISPFLLSVALLLALILGLWPITLQRYSRLRLYRIIYKRSGLREYRLGDDPEVQEN
jgi:hypothetical protein